MSTPARDIRVLVIDDSQYNRESIRQILENTPGVRVVGHASDGNEGLRQVVALEPDVITLDLEMPRMDGYTFLRILMSRRPTPVVVVSSSTGMFIAFQPTLPKETVRMARCTPFMSLSARSLGMDVDATGCGQASRVVRRRARMAPSTPIEMPTTAPPRPTVRERSGNRSWSAMPPMRSARSAPADARNQPGVVRWFDRPARSSMAPTSASR